MTDSPNPHPSYSGNSFQPTRMPSTTMGPPPRFESAHLQTNDARIPNPDTSANNRQAIVRRQHQTHQIPTAPRSWEYLNSRGLGVDARRSPNNNFTAQRNGNGNPEITSHDPGFGRYPPTSTSVPQPLQGFDGGYGVSRETRHTIPRVTPNSGVVGKIKYQPNPSPPRVRERETHPYGSGNARNAPALSSLHLPLPHSHNEYSITHLRSEADWEDWISRIRDRAILLNVWQYISPFDANPPTRGPRPVVTNTHESRARTVEYHRDQENLDRIDRMIHISVDQRYRDSIIRTPDSSSSQNNFSNRNQRSTDTTNARNNHASNNHASIIRDVLTNHGPQSGRNNHYQDRFATNTASRGRDGDQQSARSIAEAELMRQDALRWLSHEPLSIHAKLRALYKRILRERIDVVMEEM